MRTFNVLCLTIKLCVFNVLQYKNVRPDYVKSIWKIVNWKDVGDRLAAAK